MPVGDCERAFARAAASDGVVLARARVPWLNQRGHYGLPSEASSVVDVLDNIFNALDGLAGEQKGKRLTSLPGDFLHEPSGTFIEIDESQHFTSWRLRALNLYPPESPLGFDLQEYRSLCAEWAPRSDRYRASKAAKGFGRRGRQRQRAYNDALRDLVVPAMGHPPLVRVPAPARDGVAAYERVRTQLRSLTG